MPLLISGILQYVLLFKYMRERGIKMVRQLDSLPTDFKKSNEWPI